MGQAVLLVNGSSRTEHTCPARCPKHGGWWKSRKARSKLRFRRPQSTCSTLAGRRLNLARRFIHANLAPNVDGAVSPAVQLLSQLLWESPRLMNEIYPLWVAAHGIMVITPVNWYQAPGPLKAMMNRLVCADGSNSDPSSTHGKKADETKSWGLQDGHTLVI